MLGPGSRIAGYRIVRLLGRGGMGRVFEATKVAHGRPVALKILNEELGDDEAFRARFRREGRVQAELAHPHVVPVLETGEAEGHLFIAMQLVHGVTLKQLIVKRPLEPPRAVELLSQVADALDAAHAAGLIHRDIKPQNVLVGADDHAYLADFGLTKTLSDSTGLTRTGQFMGTYDYISPEQIIGMPATTASDMYAMAALLYESLTGSVPFPRDAEAAVLFAHVSSEAPAPSTLRASLPTELDAVLARGLAKEPADRPATATELMESTARALGGRLVLPPSEEGRAHAAGGRGGRARVKRRTFTAADFPSTMEPGSRIVPPESDPTLRVPDHLPPELGDEVPPRDDTPPRRRRLAAIGAAGVTLAIAAVAGLLLGGGGSAPDATTTRLTQAAANGTVAVSFPASWRRHAALPLADRLGLRDPITLAGPAAGTTVSVGTTSTTRPELVAANAVAGTLPEPERVRVGDLSAYRYAGVRVPGTPGRVDLIAAPSTAGVVTLACTPSGAPDCAPIAASVRLQRGRPASLDPDKTYATALGGVLRTFDRRRDAARRTLARATGPASQSEAARAAASAARRAATALADLSPGPRETTAHHDLRAALTASGDAYAHLGTAARDSDRKAYSAAASDVRRADQRITATLADLEKLGYHIT